MAKTDRVNSVGLDAAAVAGADRLLDEIKLEGTETSREKLVRALLWGLTGPPAAGIVRAYIAHTARSETDASTPP
jgi:hypothetical protein